MFPSLPRRLDCLGIDIVRGCQLRCIGCANSALKPKIEFMPVQDFDACLRNVDVPCVRLLRLYNFGEALLHPDVPEILRQIPKQRCCFREVELRTNAQAHDFSMLAEVFKTRILGRLCVSCDGDGTAEDYERLRPPGKWDRLMSFLAKARELRDAHSPKTKLTTSTICETEEGRRRWSGILESFGFEPVFIGWLSLVGSVKTPLGASELAANGLCEYVQRKRTLYVDYDGTVVTCCWHPRAGVLGSLKQSRCSEILRGEPQKDFARRLMTSRGEMPVCGRCTVRRHRHRYEKLLALPFRWLRQAD